MILHKQFTSVIINILRGINWNVSKNIFLKQGSYTLSLFQMTTLEMNNDLIVFFPSSHRKLTYGEHQNASPLLFLLECGNRSNCHQLMQSGIAWVLLGTIYNVPRSHFRTIMNYQQYQSASTKEQHQIVNIRT